MYRTKVGRYLQKVQIKSDILNERSLEGFLCQDPAVQRNLNFCAHSARPLRKLEKNHVLLWIKFILNWKRKVCLQQPAMFCLSDSNVSNLLPDLGNNPSLVYQILRTLIYLINSLLDERLSIWVEVVGPASSESSSSSLKNF